MGNMKANDVAIAVDSVKYSGFTSRTTAYVKGIKIRTKKLGDISSSHVMDIRVPILPKRE